MLLNLLVLNFFLPLVGGETEGELGKAPPTHDVTSLLILEVIGRRHFPFVALVGGANSGAIGQDRRLLAIPCTIFS